MNQLGSVALSCNSASDLLSCAHAGAPAIGEQLPGKTNDGQVSDSQVRQDCALNWLTGSFSPISLAKASHMTKANVKESGITPLMGRAKKKKNHMHNSSWGISSSGRALA